MLLNLKTQLFLRRTKQCQLAAELGISPCLLSEIITGRREADAELRRRIALLLEADESFLFRRVTAPPFQAGGAPSVEADRLDASAKVYAAS